MTTPNNNNDESQPHLTSTPMTDDNHQDSRHIPSLDPNNNPDKRDMTMSSSASDDDTFDSETGHMSVHRRRRTLINIDGALNTRHRVPDSAELKHHRRQRGAERESKYKSWASGAVSHYREKKDWASTLLPMLKWLRTYKVRESLSKDLVAGCTVGVMIVPQSMSYAKLAGLPVEYGLYSAVVPVFAYALFGSSRQLAVGPVALISLMLSTGLTHIVDPTGELSSHSEGGKNGIESDPELQTKYNTLAVQTAFLVGIFYIVMGLLRLGFVTIFLSHAVISGFTTGAAVIIGMSQLKYILGYDVERSDVLHEILHNVFKDIDQFNWKTFLMGTCSIIALVLLKHIGKTYPKFKWVRALGPLTVTIVTIFLTWVCDFDEESIPVVGSIPRGLPNWTGNVWTPIIEFDSLIKTIIGIVVVGFMESIAIAKQLASKHKYELDSSLELIGLGMANFAGAMFQSYPVTGSFSRSAVNNDSGAVSGISACVTATLVMLVLLFLTPIFELLPLAVLAAIVISGVLGLLDYTEAIYLWRVHKFDFFVWMVACLGTMFLGVEIGLAIAVGVSLLLVTYESAYPHTAVLGRLPGTTVYRNVKQYPEAERYDGIVMVRIDAPIYFANTQNVREKLNKYEAAAEARLAERRDSNTSVMDKNGKLPPQRVKFIIMELSPVSHVDTSALHILHDIHSDYKARGVQLCFSNPNVQVMERFVTSGFADEVGREHFFVTIHDAVDFCLLELDNMEVSMHGAPSNTPGFAPRLGEITERSDDTPSDDSPSDDSPSSEGGDDVEVGTNSNTVTWNSAGVAVVGDDGEDGDGSS